MALSYVRIAPLFGLWGVGTLRNLACEQLKPFTFLWCFLFFMSLCRLTGCHRPLYFAWNQWFFVKLAMSYVRIAPWFGLWGLGSLRNLACEQLKPSALWWRSLFLMSLCRLTGCLGNKCVFLRCVFFLRFLQVSYALHKAIGSSCIVSLQRTHSIWLT